MRRFRFAALAALTLWLGTQVSLALTVSDVRSAVRRYVRDTASSTSQRRYSDATLLLYINEAQRDVVNRTWCLQKTSSQSISVGTTYYSLPTDLIAVQEANFRETSTGITRQLTEKSERALYQENPDYERQRGPPQYYFIRNSTSAAAQLEYGLNPVPSTSTQLGTLLLDYYNQPADLASDSDIPLSSYRYLYPYHDTLIYYAAAQIKIIEGDTEEATALLNLYEARIKLMLDRLGRMPNYNPGFQVGK